ncbi:LOW QUALITY PROTEIN: hypothetical protein V2J09_006267 [Rumex salicifolius]
MGDYLIKSDFTKWARVHCKGDKYMTINNSETINGVLKQARSYQIVAMLEFIRDMLTRWFNERREEIKMARTTLPPNIQKNTREETQLVKEVLGSSFYGVVDLKEDMVFDLDHIPFVHALAAIKKAKLNISNFQILHFNAWQTAYRETIYHVPIQSETVPEDVISITCLPPIVAKKDRRKRKKRMPSIGEFKGKMSKTSTRRLGKCSI